MNKNIGILTQPLHQNYGGLLQAYALQSTLKKFGYTPYIIDRNPKYLKASLMRRIASHVKTTAYKIMGRKRAYTCFLTNKERSIIALNTDCFINQCIQPKSEKLYSNQEIAQYVNRINPFALIVGSDQVWRPMYSPHLPTYFFDFAKNNKEVKRLSYAASFGVSNWEFSKEQEDIARELIHLFDAVSVREDSGVGLCAKYLNCKAEHVLDPTMLLSKEDYIELAKIENEPISEGDLFTYVLDKTDRKKEFIAKISEELGLKSFEVMPKKKITRSNINKNIDDCVYPTVTKWIRAFMDAKFVVTDSFHGCVFSILFNKPFIALGNKDRGLARFQSLLAMFNLEDRLNSDDVTQPIDWNGVNSALSQLRVKSMKFLEDNLNGKA